VLVVGVEVEVVVVVVGSGNVLRPTADAGVVAAISHPAMLGF